MPPAQQQQVMGRQQGRATATLGQGSTTAGAGQSGADLAIQQSQADRSAMADHLHCAFDIGGIHVASGIDSCSAGTSVPCC